MLVVVLLLAPAEGKVSKRAEIQAQTTGKTVQSKAMEVHIANAQAMEAHQGIRRSDKRKKTAVAKPGIAVQTTTPQN